MAFPPNHHAPEKQAARANKRYEKSRANKTRRLDEIAKSGLSRSVWYRLNSKSNKPACEETVPVEIEKLIANSVASDYGTVPIVTELTPEPIEPEDEEDFEYVYKRLNISPHRAYEWREEGKLKLLGGMWTYQE